MPVYEYRCQSCNKQFEYEHRMSEKRTECEACGGALERLISRTSFAFKGGGWYKDLYSSTKPNPADSGGKSDVASTDTADTSSHSEKSASADKPASISTGSGDKSGGSSGTGGSSSGGSSSGGSGGSSSGGSGGSSGGGAPAAS